MRANGGISFESIYYAYYRPLYFFALELIRDEAEAQDVVADTFVKYYERKEHFEEERQIKSFLYTTVKHAALNALRHRKIRETKSDALVKELTKDESTFFDKLVLTELIRQIAEEVEHLPDMQRQVFALSYFEGKTTAEICDVLGINAESVYNNRKRALQKLKLVFKTKNLSLYIAFIQLFF